jgi:hypothetical protein
MDLVKRDDDRHIWVLDDAEQLDGPMDQLGSRTWGWGKMLPVLQKADITVFLGMKTRANVPPKTSLPKIIQYATRLGLNLDPVATTTGNVNTAGVVVDVNVWKSRSFPAGQVAGQVWIRPLHTLLVSETESGEA